MKIDAVFSGGGVKSFAFLGALQGMRSKGLEIERVAGTSAGAIVAGLLAANYSLKELKEAISSLKLQELSDPPLISKMIPFSKWFYLYFKMGIYKGDRFEEWLYERLSEKNVYTFRDIKPGYLKIVVSDLSLGKLVVIPDDLERVYGIDPDHFLIARAIRMSSGYPYFFMPMKINGKIATESLIVDGGLLSNYPLWIFDKPNERNLRPVLGVKLSDNVANADPKKITNVVALSQALFSTMKQAHDVRYVSTSQQKNTIFIPIKHVETTNFHIDDKTKKRLIELGENSASDFLMNWP